MIRSTALAVSCALVFGACDSTGPPLEDTSPLTEDDVAQPAGAAAAGLEVGTVVVRPGDLAGPDEAGWQIVPESAPGGTASLVVGPGSPPLGGGSAAMALSANGQGITLQYYDADLVGVPLSSLTTLSYCTYVDAAPGPQAPALQLNFDDDVTDGDTSWKGRMVFEPYQNEAVAQDEWQCWDAMAGLWWGSGAPLNTVAPQSSPQSLATILASFPNAGSNSAFGGLIVKAGSGWSGFDGNVDAVSLGIDGAETTFDFEAGPADKEECKRGGWADFGFRNQGQCIKHVNTGS